MAAHTVEALLVVPTFVEGLEDMNELGLAQAVEMGDHGVELVDHVLLLIGRKRTALDAYCFRPVDKPLVRAGKPPPDFHSALPE